jgi:N-acetylmuramoyl-L-alanine amidase
VKSLRLALALLVGVSLASAAHAAGGGPCAKAYEQARRTYRSLQSSVERQRHRHRWLEAIAAFNAVVADYPDAPQAPEALYTSGRLWAGLHRWSHRASDLDQAVSAFGRVAAEYPKSQVASEARKAWRAIAPGQPGGTARLDAVGPRALVGRRDEKGGPVTITALKHWSSASYSRVVLYLSGPAEAQSQVGSPESPKVEIDVPGARLGSGLEADRALDDALLEGARLQSLDGGVRLALELKRPARHRVLVLENPYRVVVDAFTSAPASPSAEPERKHRVVIDPGHGGHDGGARSPAGVQEKDVTLALARELEQQLTARGVEVVLTRSDDSYVGLEERTAIANRAAADLFISIHTNAHANRKARGIETYYLDTTTDRYALRLAARENATAEEQVSEVQLALADLATKLSARESRTLAAEVQRELVAGVGRKHPRTRDLGVKGSLFYVLLGARMPAVLVETAFLSNPEEGKLLSDAGFRRTAAASLARAIAGHLGAPASVAVARH